MSEQKTRKAYRPHELRPVGEPVYDVPMSVAGDDLTRWDFIAIKKAFGKTLNDLDAEDKAYALIWALEKKAGREKSVDEVSNMSSREIAAYFPDEPSDQADKDELGKASK